MHKIQCMTDVTILQRMINTCYTRKKEMDKYTLIDAGNLRETKIRIHKQQELYPDTDPDSESGLLPKFNGDFPVQGYICDKIFMKIRSLSPEI